MKHLSLFSGIGGIDLAAEWAGFHSVAMVEKDHYCQQVLRKHFPEAELYGDILEFDGTKYENRIDLISAGFPCQPFSLCGSRRGADDERALWPEVVRVLREVKPTWFLGENVPGLLTSGTQYKGEYFNYICNSLSEMGYRVGWCLFGAKDIGAAHRRNRVFIVAYSESEQRNVRETRQQLFSGEEQEQFRRGNSKHDVAYSESNTNGRELQPGLRAESAARITETTKYVGNSEGESRPQTDSCACADGSERDARKNIGGRHWQPISGGNWREWDTCPIIYETRAEPRIRGKNDGIPNRVDRLRALGNAVVPQQVFPILEEIARQMKCD